MAEEKEHNFHHRLTVETNMQGELIDHRDGFSQREYFRDRAQLKEEAEKRAAMHPMHTNALRPPQPKSSVIEGRLSDNRRALRVQNDSSATPPTAAPKNNNTHRFFRNSDDRPDE